MANLFVRDRKSTTGWVDEMDTEDMDDIFSDGIASIGWHSVVKAANVPFCFASTVDVEVIVTFGSRPFPLGLQLLTIKLDIALSTCLFRTLDLECDDLYAIGKCSLRLGTLCIILDQLVRQFWHRTLVELHKDLKEN